MPTNTRSSPGASTSGTDRRRAASRSSRVGGVGMSTRAYRETEEPACKPDPVRGAHAPPATISLGRALARPPRRGSPAPCGYPGARAGRPRTLPARLAPDGGCRAAAVARRAGGLLPHRFTLTSAPERRGGLLSVAPSRGRPRLALASVLPCGVRTFLAPVRLRDARRGRPAGSSDHDGTASTAPRGQPRVDPLVGQSIGFGVPLPRDVLETDPFEPRGELAELPVERLEVRCLHLVRAGELVDQELAVRPKQDVGGAELARPFEPEDGCGVLGDVVRGLAESLRDLRDDLAVGRRELRSRAGRAGVAARGPVAPHDQRGHSTRIRRQYSQRAIPSVRFTRSSSTDES